MLLKVFLVTDAGISLMLIFRRSFSSSSTYPEITCDAERHDYKREFDADLGEYKRLCAEMDDINDQLNKLSRQLDTLDETSAKYQVRYTQYSPCKPTRKVYLNKHPGNRRKMSLNYKSGLPKVKIIPFHCNSELKTGWS